MAAKPATWNDSLCRLFASQCNLLDESPLRSLEIQIPNSRPCHPQTTKTAGIDFGLLAMTRNHRRIAATVLCEERIGSVVPSGKPTSQFDVAQHSLAPKPAVGSRRSQRDGFHHYTLAECALD